MKKSIPDEKIILKIILTIKSKNKFFGYSTTMFSNLGLKVYVPGLKKVLWNNSKAKSKLKLDNKKNVAASNKVNKLPKVKIINNFLEMPLKLKFINKNKIIINNKNKVIER